jgi:hypothetical protein
MEFLDSLKPFPIFEEIATKQRVAPMGAEHDFALGKSIAGKINKA